MNKKQQKLTEVFIEFEWTLYQLGFGIMVKGDGNLRSYIDKYGNQDE